MFFVVISFIMSCKEKSNDNRLIKDIIKNTLDKELVLPDELKAYIPFTNYITDSTKIFKSELKIYSYVDASCATCIENIKSWAKLIPDFTKYDVSIILIFGSKDEFELIKHLCESKKVNDFPFPFFFDKKNKYLKLNKFMEHNTTFQTVLVNNNNRILLLGNPTHSKEITDMYLKEIQKRTSSND